MARWFDADHYDELLVVPHCTTCSLH